jgi:hypothetical protein
MGRLLPRRLKEFLARHLGRGSISLLEFASGYGCVTRHLVKDEDINLVSCAIHPQAISFLKDEFKVKAVLSRSIPEEVDLGGLYDASLCTVVFSSYADNDLVPMAGSALQHCAAWRHFDLHNAGSAICAFSRHGASS